MRFAYCALVLRGLPENRGLSPIVLTVIFNRHRDTGEYLTGTEGKKKGGQALHLTSMSCRLGCLLFGFKQKAWMAMPCGETGGRSGKICQM